MEKTLNILMIDDHPTILEGYKTILSYDKDKKKHILIAKDCDQAISRIKSAKLTNGFDMFFIDIQIPASKDGSLTSGEDLAKYAKKEFPEAKIVILTRIESAIRLQNIINLVPHDSILIKSDATAKMLRKAFETVLKGEKYYSKTVKIIKNRIIQNNDNLDDIDMKILYHISKGVRTNKLVQHMDLSLSAVEKRKKQIKSKFDIKGDDEQLLLEAKKRGYI
jgi:DNA-binding NarL/FixJ family response regulator